MTDRKEDLTSASIAAAKSAAGLIPGVSQVIAGYDAYRRSSHDRNMRRMLGFLHLRVESLESFFSEQWFSTEEGAMYLRKALDAALDVQSEEKQELFANVMVNSLTADMEIVEKTKFLDMLRHLSLASIQVLAEMHKLFESQTRRPGKSGTQLSALPLVEAAKLAEQLSDKYEPYLVISAVKELESQGLFSNVGAWHKVQGGYKRGQGFLNDLTYTDFSARFAEFISPPLG